MNGYNTVIVQDLGSKLSAGQRTVLLLAVALVQDYAPRSYMPSLRAYRFARVQV